MKKRISLCYNNKQKAIELSDKEIIIIGKI